MKNILDWIEENKQQFEGQEPRTLAQAPLAEDLNPGALRDEMLKGFDPSQETHEEYLQRINLERPFNAAQGGSAGQLVRNTVDGSRPGYGGFGGNITLSPTGNAYDVEVKRGDEWFRQSFHKDDYKNKSEALKAAKTFRDKKKQIPLKKTGIQLPEYGSGLSQKEYMKKYYEETKDLSDVGKLAAERDLKLRNFIGKKKKIKASVLRDFMIDDLKYEFYDASKIKKKFPNLEIIKDIKQGTDFKPLNKKEITLIKENFDLPEGVKDWNFKQHKYGISSDKYTGLYRQMKSRLKEPGKFTLAANYSTPQGWAMAAMERVLNNETILLEDGTRVLKKGVKRLTYEPITNKKGIIVGFKDNTAAGKGKTYYGLKKNAKEYGDGTAWKAHGDFKRIEKFIEIADGVKAEPNKILQKILDDKGISELTKGKRGLTLNDILSHERYYSKLSETSSKSLIRRQIVLHHTGGVGAGSDFARAAATKDIQLLTDAVNTNVKALENIVKGTKKNPARKLNADEIAKLKNYGAKIVDFDGKVVGGGFLDPERQFANIEKQALKYAKGKDFNVKTVTKYLERLGCGGKAAGGRILMRNGGATLTDCAKKGQKVLEDVRAGKITGEAAEQIAKKTSDVVAKAGSKSALTKILGPAGIGIDVIYEVASVGTDIYGGKPWKEAVQDNWIAGAFMPGTSLEEFHKRLYEEYPVGYEGDDKVKKYPEAKPYGEGLLLEEAYNKAQKNIDIIKQSTYRSNLQKEEALAEAERDLRGIAAQYNALGSIMEEGSPEHEAYMAAVTEARDADKATSFGSEASLKYQLDTPESSRFTPRDKSTMKIDYSLPKPVEISQTPLSADQLQKYAEYHRDVGDLEPRGELPQWYIDEIQQKEKWRQLFEQPGIRGTQDWRGADGGRAGYMGGGITGIRKPDAIPPERQGLRSIMINGKKS